MKAKHTALLIAVGLVALVCVQYLTACSTTGGGLQPQTLNAVAQIAALETAQRLDPGDRAKLALALKAAAKQVRLAAARGTLTAGDVVAAVKSHGLLGLPPDVQRYIREVAILVDAQWRGVKIRPAQALDFAQSLETTAAMLE